MKPSVLVAYDFSPIADEALAWAADLHRSLGGRMHVVYVQDPYPISDAILPFPVPGVDLEDVAQVEAELCRMLARLAPDATCEVVTGSPPGPKILEVARAWRATLVVLGTHGRGGVARLVMGSVAQHVVRHADCPVVTLHVRPGADD